MRPSTWPASPACMSCTSAASASSRASDCVSRSLRPMPCTWATVSIEDQDQTFFSDPGGIAHQRRRHECRRLEACSELQDCVRAHVWRHEINVHNIEADVIGMSGSGAGAGTENLLLNATFSLGAGREGSSSVGGKIDLRAIHRLRKETSKFMDSRRNAKSVPSPKSPFPRIHEKLRPAEQTA